MTTLKEAIEIVNASETHQAVPMELTSAMREAFHEAQEEWENPPMGVIGPDSPDHQWAALMKATPRSHQEPDSKEG